MSRGNLEAAWDRGTRTKLAGEICPRRGVICSVRRSDTKSRGIIGGDIRQGLEAMISRLSIRIVEALTAFFAWWGGELLLLTPELMRRWLVRPRDQLHILLDGDALRIGGCQPEGQEGFRFGQGDELPSAARAAIRKGARAILYLPAAQVLRRNIELPMAAVANLQQAASFQVGRVTPFQPEQVCHTTRLIARDRERKVVRVELAVVAHAVLKPALATIESQNISLSAIRVVGDSTEPALDFLPHQPRQLFARRGVGSIRATIMAVGVVLLMLFPFVFAYSIHAKAERLATQLAATATSARHATDLRAKFDARVAGAMYLPDRQHGLRAIEVLDALTRAIPDSTWLFRFELRANKVLLSGFSSDVPELLSRLAAPPFKEPEPTSQVVDAQMVDGRAGQSRFELGVRLEAAQP